MAGVVEMRTLLTPLNVIPFFSMTSFVVLLKGGSAVTKMRYRTFL